MSGFACVPAGENPDTHQIQPAIRVHLAPTNAKPTASSERLQEMMRHLPLHLRQYHDEFDVHVRHWTWTPTGLSSETVMIATELGRCLVDAPELREKLITLLKSQEKQHLSDMSNTTEAVVLEAIRILIRDGREHAYAREIATGANSLLAARGERTRLSPEKVAHILRKLGLRTHTLSQSGNGLTFNKVCIGQIFRPEHD